MNSLIRKQITLRLKSGLAERIEKKANELGISVNAYISMILSKETNKNPTPGQ